MTIGQAPVREELNAEADLVRRGPPTSRWYRPSLRRVAAGVFILASVGTPVVFSQEFQPQPTCEHAGSVVEGPDVVQPVVRGQAYQIQTRWLRHLPVEVFGPRRATVAVSYRVDEQGTVTSACVERGVREAVNEAVRRSLLSLGFTAATRAGLPVPVLVRQQIDLIRPEGEFAAEVSVDATDETWLERIATDPASDTRIRQSPVLSGLYRSIRLYAFARLGELGTAEGLAAIQRIEGRLSGTVQTPATVPLNGYPHAALHMYQDPARPIAEADLGGVRVRLVPLSLFGRWDPFLVTNKTPRDDSTWTRPILTAVRWSREDQSADLTVDPNGGLVLSAGQQRHFLDLSNVRRDTDGDGWTDFEEARLGLRADQVDSDGDGLPDGHDVCPLLPVTSETVSGDEREILRHALLFVFALGGSRHLLLVDSQSPKVHLDGYSGPVLYDIDSKRWLAQHGSVSVSVSWKILARTAGEAAVEITDFVAPLAASGQKVYLRKLGSRWVVVGRVTTWIS